MLPATVSIQPLPLLLPIVGVPVGLVVMGVCTSLERHADVMT